jgi:4-amino-4-deoxy-L-arabinose transferase-like glycosyltransferase
MGLRSASSARLKNLSSSLERFGYARASLIVVIVLMLSLVVVRFYHASVTGFILPDEAWYYNVFIAQNTQYTYYREVFVTVYKFFFQGVRDISSLLLRGAVYSAIWVVGCVVMTYKIILRMQVPDKTAALLLLSLPLFPVFTVMAVMITTETFGLFLALVGIYFAIRYLQNGRVLDALLSSVGFLMAYKVREPYYVLAVGYLLIILLSRKRSIPAILAYAVPLFLVLPLPISLEPLMFTQPLYAVLIQALQALQALPSHPGPPSPPSLSGIYNALSPSPAPLDSRAVKIDTPEAFFIGLLYGYNPLFMVFTFISLGLLVRNLLARRSERSAFILLSMTLGLSSYLVSVLVTVGTIAANYGSFISSWSSTIIRMTHTSLPAFLGFGYLYERVKARHLMALIVIFLVLASTQIPQFTNSMETALNGPLGEPIDRLSFSYRAPYYRLYLLAKDSGKTLVVTTQDRGIILYMSMLPNAVVEPVPPNEIEFKTLLDNGWDTVFLYDDWYTIKDPALAVKNQWYPPYYLDILLQKRYQGYCVETLWVDGESYALRMVKANAGSCGSSTEDYARAFPIQSTFNSIRLDRSGTACMDRSRRYFTLQT